MKVQKSFEKNEGVLYVVGTPIGHLQDMSQRAKDILQHVQVIAAEDTRHTRKLLTHFQITTPLLSYHRHNAFKRDEQLIERLLAGDSVAIVSDAGTPAISDPGESLIKKAIEYDIPVVPIPGPNAAVAALIPSGLCMQSFVFIGFLPKIKKRRKEELKKWAKIPATLLFYEAPHRLLSMLKEIEEELGNRKISISREITKKNEEYIRGYVRECIDYIDKTGVKGECTIVVEGYYEKDNQEERPVKTDLIVEQVDMYVKIGYSTRDAICKVAEDIGLTKKEVYKNYHTRSSCKNDVE
jgi:16S rRNA (cytidine1402-2'-O)-methyltransferase